MPISRKVREQMLAMCGSIGQDDGPDFKARQQKKGQDASLVQHGTERLCHQVARALRLVITSDVGDQLDVLRVVPAAQRGVLRVQFEPGERSGSEQQQALESLRLREGWLRSEVAAHITRKRVPRLRFEFSLPGASS